MASVLFVVGSTTLSAGDTALRSLMTGAGHSVTNVDDDSGAPGSYETTYDIVVISASCNSGSVDTDFLSASIPVLLLEGYAADGGGTAAWISANPSSNGFQTSVWYEDDSRVAWTGQTVDSAVTITSGTIHPIGGSVGSGWVTWLEQGAGSGAPIAGTYEAGTTVYGGDAANARYGYFGFGDAEYASWNAAQEQAFEDLFNWLLGIQPIVVPQIDAAATVYAPVVSVVAPQSIALPLIDASPSIGSVDVAVGPIYVAVPHLDCSASVYAPVLERTAVLYIYRPPTEPGRHVTAWRTVAEQRRHLHPKLVNAADAGVAVLKEAGEYRTTRMPSTVEIANADACYMGGHENVVDDLEKALIEASGVGGTFELVGA